MLGPSNARARPLLAGREFTIPQVFPERGKCHWIRGPGEPDEFGLAPDFVDARPTGSTGWRTGVLRRRLRRGRAAARRRASTTSSVRRWPSSPWRSSRRIASATSPSGTPATSRCTWRPRCPIVIDGRTRFITNAGGINPISAGRAVVEGLRAPGRDRGDGRDGGGRRPSAPRRRARRSRNRRCSPRPTSVPVRSWRPWSGEPTSSSPAGWRTHRCSSPRSCSSTGGRGTTGTASPRASPSDTCSSAPPR